MAVVNGNGNGHIHKEHGADADGHFRSEAEERASDGVHFAKLASRVFLLSAKDEQRLRSNGRGLERLSRKGTPDR